MCLGESQGKVQLLNKLALTPYCFALCSATMLRSCFVQGRSGTGKTTIIVHKLLLVEEMWRNGTAAGCGLDANGTDSGGGGSGQGSSSCISGAAAGAARGVEGVEVEARPRQLLVTQSAKLCAAMRGAIGKVTRVREATAAAKAAAASGDPSSGSALDDLLLLDEEEEAKLLGNLPDRLADVGANHCPLVITYRRFLLMLDACLDRPFVERFVAAASGQRPVLCGGAGIGAGHAGADAGRADLHGGYEGSDGGDYGRSTSDKESEEGNDFGDGLGSEATLAGAGGSGDAAARSRCGRSGGAGGRRRGQVQREPQEVDYARFAAAYWPHLDAGEGQGQACVLGSSNYGGVLAT